MITTLFFAAFILGGSLSVRITQLKVPPLVRNGSSSVSLECDFSLEPGEQQGLVVKWFLNSVPTPVYQWIPDNKPQDLGLLKGRLDLNFGKTSNRSAGLQILRPTTELSGDYKCAVSTFEGEDFMIKKMVVFAPGGMLEVKHSKPTETTVNVTCSAEGVFPEPRMTLYMTTAAEDHSAKEIRLDSATIETALRGDAYKIRATCELEDLITPTEFHCELRVPEAQYHIRKTLSYHPGSPMAHPDTKSSSPSTIRSSLVVMLCVIAIRV